MTLHVAAVAPIVAGVLFTAHCIYSLFFGPLAKLPGPKLYALTDIPYLYHIYKGTWQPRLLELHDKYGPTIRISPHDVSTIAPESWKVIYGHKTQQNKNFEKDPTYYGKTLKGVDNIVRADTETHRRMRRVLAHAFSEKALHGQEAIVNHYVNLFISRLSDKAAAGENIDIMSWFNFTTFDLIGDLSFGKPFGCLESGGYNPWVKMIFQYAANMAIAQIIRRHPFLQRFQSWIIPSELTRSFVEHAQLSERTALERIERGSTDRADFLDFILKHNGDEQKGMSVDEIAANSSSLIVAGSETTATQLSGTTYFLLTNRDKYDKVVKEIRGRFASEDEINMDTVNNLEYMLAVLNESFRMYPPVPTGLGRMTPHSGEIVDGYLIPGEIGISVPQFVAYQSASNFADPQKFVPERWLGTDPRYANDRREVLQPFSTGPRNCIGKNLAYAEMRVILARLLWRFDLELLPESKDWHQQRIFLAWEKPALMVKITAAKRS